MKHPWVGMAHATALFCSFPQASNQTLLDKFKRQHEGNSYIEFPAVMEPAFIIRHYAGKVKYGVKVRSRLLCVVAKLQPDVCLSQQTFLLLITLILLFCSLFKLIVSISVAIATNHLPPSQSFCG